jgi:hypothetical protein
MQSNDPLCHGQAGMHHPQDYQGSYTRFWKGILVVQENWGRQFQT